MLGPELLDRVLDAVGFIEVEASFADRFPIGSHHALLAVVEGDIVNASQHRLVATQFEPSGMVAFGDDFAPRPLLAAATLVLRARGLQRELRKDVVVATDESVLLPQDPCGGFPETPSGSLQRGCIEPEPLSPHPFDLMGLRGRVDRRVGIADTCVDVMRTDLLDPFNQVVRLLRLVFDDQHFDRCPVHLDLAEMERRES